MKSSRLQVVAADALFGQLALHHNLGGDAGVVGARNPAGVVALHAVIAGQAVHDGLVEGVAHVQGAGHIGGGSWMQKDGLLRSMCGFEIAGAFPARVPTVFQITRFEALASSMLCLRNFDEKVSDYTPAAGVAGGGRAAEEKAGRAEWARPADGHKNRPHQRPVMSWYTVSNPAAL